MQALRPTVFLCYGAADRETAQHIAELLERGTDAEIFVDEGEVQPGEDIVEKARQGRMAESVIVLFSRATWPRPRPRTEWEDALIKEPREEEVRIAFVRCDDCVPPKVLDPQFDLRQLRELKRWVRQREATYAPPEGFTSPERAADLEWLGVAIADRPGAETVDDTGLAFDFARACRGDFDEILYVQCGERSLTALVGDLGWQLGLKLEGTVEQNLERVRLFCEERRLLVLLDDARPAIAERLTFGGRCSTLISTDGGPPPTGDDLRDAQTALARQEGEWDELCRLARIGRRVSRDRGRIAECFEMMRQWQAMAEVEEDTAVLDEAGRELVWILEMWGMQEDAKKIEYRRATMCDEQLPLF